MNDIERLLAKICSRFNNPKDMIGLRDALVQLPVILDWLRRQSNIFENSTLHLNFSSHSIP